MRVFVAIELPEAHQRQIIQIIQSYSAQAQGVRWIQPYQAHVTLKFLGSVADNSVDQIQRALSEVARGCKPLTLCLGGLGFFPNARSPQVAWIGVKQGASELSTWAKSIENALYKEGFSKSSKDFHAHVTLGRILRGKKVHSKQFSPDKASQIGEPFEVNSFALYQSATRPEGAVHTVLNRFDVIAA